MNTAVRTVLSILTSVACGCVFAVAAALPDSEVVLVLPIGIFVGGFIGAVLSPAAIFAMAIEECRPSFVWVCLPTAAVTFLGSIIGGPVPGSLVSVIAYVSLCIIVGAVAIRRRKHLKWYRNGRCSTCGYDMSGLDEALCPECGHIARLRPMIRVPNKILRS